MHQTAFLMNSQIDQIISIFCLLHFFAFLTSKSQKFPAFEETLVVESMVTLLSIHNAAVSQETLSDVTADYFPKYIELDTLEHFKLQIQHSEPHMKFKFFR